MSLAKETLATRILKVKETAEADPGSVTVLNQMITLFEARAKQTGDVNVKGLVFQHDNLAVRSALDVYGALRTPSNPLPYEYAAKVLKRIIPH